MRRLKLILSMIGLVGVVACANKVGYTKPTPSVENLTPFVQASGLIARGTECVLVSNYKNGRSTQVNVSPEICREARLAVAVIQADVNKQEKK